MHSEYYEGEEIERFSFYRVPRLIMTEARYSALSVSAKLLYSLLLDRTSLSIRNNWRDDAGRVYIYFTVKEICGEFHCCRDTAMKLLAELDSRNGIGLIDRIRQGQGKPDRIYVKKLMRDGEATGDQIVGERMS